MSEVKYYHVSDTGLSEGVSLGRITVVLGADFDRVTAERDVLQHRLTVADQRVDDLVARLGHQSAPTATAEQCQFPQMCTTMCRCKPESQRIVPAAKLCDCNQGRLPCTCKSTEPR